MTLDPARSDSTRRRRLVLFAALLGLVALSGTPGEARPRRGAPRPVDHYTISPERLSAYTEPYRGTYDHVILLNELRTEVTDGKGLCRLGWQGRTTEAGSVWTSRFSFSPRCP